MAQEKMYKAALEAINQGQTGRARDLFTRLLRSDSSKAEYWLWMSTLVDTVKERAYCLESALRVDPNNEAAKRGLIILGARKVDKEVKPAALIRRHWEKELEQVVEPPKPIFRRIWENPFLRIAALLGALIVIGGLVYASFTMFRKQPEQLVIYKVSPFPTNTLVPSITPTITKTSLIPTPTTAMLPSTPLWAFLTQTYTPVPLYVNTPHPAIEAYRAGVRSFERGDWSSLLSFMGQATTAEPDAPDLYYYLGEAYRMLGSYQEAVNAYGKALSLKPEFAPAYLGRALAYEKIDPQADIEGELNYAIGYDGYYVDAYLARAGVRIEHNNPNGALEDLVLADSLFPNHPMVYVLRAQAYLKLNDLAAAMQNAQLGFDLDRTSLPAYYTLALVYLANGNNEQAVHYINIYLVYIQDDGQAWAIKTQAEYQLGNYDLALAACEQGTQVDAQNAPAWYYCGLIYLFLGDSNTAVNDLVQAVNLNLTNFDYSVALGKALWADGRLAMAIRQFTSAESLAASDYERAVIYYNRAQINEAADELRDASDDWERLLALPADKVPAEWRTMAQERWNILNPPTPTETPTETPVPTDTITPTPTPVPTLTNTPTPKRTPSK